MLAAKMDVLPFLLTAVCVVCLCLSSAARRSWGVGGKEKSTFILFARYFRHGIPSSLFQGAFFLVSALARSARELVSDVERLRVGAVCALNVGPEAIPSSGFFIAITSTDVIPETLLRKFVWARTRNTQPEYAHGCRFT